MMIVFVVSLMASSVIVYFILMCFFPEWVGITGKSAKEHMRIHSDGSEVDIKEENLFR